MIEWLLIQLGLRSACLDEDDDDDWETEREIKRYAAFLPDEGGT